MPPSTTTTTTKSTMSTTPTKDGFIFVYNGKKFHIKTKSSSSSSTGTTNNNSNNNNNNNCSQQQEAAVVIPDEFFFLLNGNKYHKGKNQIPYQVPKCFNITKKTTENPESSNDNNVTTISKSSFVTIIGIKNNKSKNKNKKVLMLKAIITMTITTITASVVIIVALYFYQEIRSYCNLLVSFIEENNDNKIFGIYNMVITKSQLYIFVMTLILTLFLFIVVLYLDSTYYNANNFYSIHNFIDRSIEKYLLGIDRDKIKKANIKTTTGTEQKQQQQDGINEVGSLSANDKVEEVSPPLLTKLPIDILGKISTYLKVNDVACLLKSTPPCLRKSKEIKYAYMKHNYNFFIENNDNYRNDVTYNSKGVKWFSKSLLSNYLHGWITVNKDWKLMYSKQYYQDHFSGSTSSKYKDLYYEQFHRIFSDINVVIETNLTDVLVHLMYVHNVNINKVSIVPITKVDAAAPTTTTTASSSSSNNNNNAVVDNKTTRYCTPLSSAVVHGNLHLFHNYFLYNPCLEPNLIINPILQSTVMHVAVQECTNRDIYRLLINHPFINLNKQLVQDDGYNTRRGMTPLHIICYQSLSGSSYWKIHYLLNSKRVNPFIRDYYNKTPLDYLLMNGNNNTRRSSSGSSSSSTSYCYENNQLLIRTKIELILLLRRHIEKTSNSNSNSNSNNNSGCSNSIMNNDIDQYFRNSLNNDIIHTSLDSVYKSVIDTAAANGCISNSSSKVIQQSNGEKKTITTTIITESTTLPKFFFVSNIPIVDSFNDEANYTGIMIRTKLSNKKRNTDNDDNDNSDENNNSSNDTNKGNSSGDDDSNSGKFHEVYKQIMNTSNQISYQPHIYGRFVYKDGRTYEGDLQYGHWHGQHAYVTFPNGDTYQGGHKLDQRHTTPSSSSNDTTGGIYKWHDGRVYSGSFVHDTQTGEGLYTWPDGASYKGSFVNSKFNGYGKYIFADKSIYKGEWKNSLMHGKGVMMWGDVVGNNNNGNGTRLHVRRKYKGDWQYGKANGYGIETTFSGDNNGRRGRIVQHVRHDGLWFNDKPIILKDHIMNDKCKKEEVFNLIQKFITYESKNISIKNNNKNNDNNNNNESRDDDDDNKKIDDIFNLFNDVISVFGEIQMD